MGIAVLVSGCGLGPVSICDCDYLPSEKTVALFPLHPEVTVAYDTARGALWRVWIGPTGKGIDPTGPLLFETFPESAWWLAGADDTAWLRPHLDSLRGPGERPTLHGSLVAEDGRRMHVSEQLEYHDQNGDHGMFRRFEVAGLGEGELLRLRLSGPPPEVRYLEQWTVSAAGRLENRNGADWLVVEQDGLAVALVSWSGSGSLE